MSGRHFATRRKQVLIGHSRYLNTVPSRRGRPDTLTDNIVRRRAQMCRLPAIMQQSEAEIFALKALSFLAAGDKRLERFLAATGMNYDDLRGGASNTAVLGGILDYFLENEGLLLAFCESSGLQPKLAVQARALLPAPPAESS